MCTLLMPCKPCKAADTISAEKDPLQFFILRTRTRSEVRTSEHSLLIPPKLCSMAETSEAVNISVQLCILGTITSSRFLTAGASLVMYRIPRITSATLDDLNTSSQSSIILVRTSRASHTSLWVLDADPRPLTARPNCRAFMGLLILFAFKAR